MNNQFFSRFQPLLHGHEDSCGCGCGHDHEEHHHAHHCHHNNETIYIIENLGCANCAAKMEARINDLPGVESATITFATKQLCLAADHPEELLPEIQKICSSIESEVKVVARDSRPRTKDAHSHDEEKEGHRELLFIILGALLFAVGIASRLMELNSIATLLLFVASYAILGGPILLEAVKNISHGQIFDENFLMSVATLGAFAIREYPEAAGVMLFYRIGEFLEHKAVARSRSQIMDAIDLRPEVVNLLKDDQNLRASSPGEGTLRQPQIDETVWDFYRGTYRYILWRRGLSCCK